MYFLLPVVVILFFVGWSCRSTNDKGYPLNESVGKLLASGDRYEGINPDSALIYYTIAAGKYEPSMSEEDKKMCVMALYGKWKIYFYCYFDYAEAYAAISEAQAICEENGFSMPEVRSGLGILYWTISEECNDSTFLVEAFKNIHHAFRESMYAQLDGMHGIGSNMFYGAFLTDSMDAVKEDLTAYRRIDNVSDSVRFRYNIVLYDALMSLRDKNYENSASILESSLSLFPDTINFVRHWIITLDLLSKAYEGQGNETKAREVLEQALDIAERYGVKDACVELYGSLSENCRRTGLDKLAKDFDYRQFLLRDSLIGFRQLSRIKDINSGREIKKIEIQLTSLQGERHLQRIVIAVSAVFLTLLACLALLLFNRNRLLRESNRRLYAKNQEILAHSEEERKLRKAYEGSLKTCGEQNSEEGTLSYSGSHLDEECKKELMEKILSVMDNTEEYLSPDFTLERLAELIGSKYKLVSQVINEKLECNFNSFVNGYRIREACRRISDIKSYGHLTLDAISKGVGFRARSSFVGAFKQQTGMTPSQYQKIAREESRRIGGNPTQSEG